MLKQGFMWFTLASISPSETVYINPDILREMACNHKPHCNFLYGFFQYNLPEDTIDVEVTV